MEIKKIIKFLGSPRFKKLSKNRKPGKQCFQTINHVRYPVF
ncbi:hypothetical protein P244_4528 [Klebsiella pneumoniae HK787]|nr:hypothetical protein P244_4528 [Klebsiella pneumoniae HK787]